MLSHKKIAANSIARSFLMLHSMALFFLLILKPYIFFDKLSKINECLNLFK